MIAEETNQRGTRTGEIVYKSGNRVVSSIDARVNGFAFDYYSNDHRFRFNDVLGDNRWKFVSVDCKLQVLFADPPEVQVPFYVYSTDYLVVRDELFDILATLHETGHATLYNASHDAIARCLESGRAADLESTLSDTPLGHLRKTDSADSLPLPDFKGNFRAQLTETLEFFSKYFLQGEYNKFQERYAWAFAIWHVLQNDLLLEFDFEDFRQCYIPRLRSYGYDHVNWPNPSKFGKWLASDPLPWNVRKEARSWKDTDEGRRKAKDFKLLLSEI